MLIDRIWWGHWGKYLGLGHEERNSLLSVRRSWPRAKYFSVRPYHSINKYTVFRFCKSRFYHSWCNWTWKMKCYSCFKRKCQALVFIPLKGLIFNKLSFLFCFVFFLTLSCLYVIIESLSLWTFHFLAGVICMIEDKTTKKTKWLYFGLARHTFMTNDGYKIIQIVRTLS